MRKYSPVNFSDVAVEGPFWHERLETVLTKTIPSQYRQLEKRGILESLTIPRPVPPLRIPRTPRHDFTTQIFWDSDVGKWIEAASYALQHRRDATIEAQIDQITDWLAKAQLSDGYLNCWYIGREIENRWTNLRDNHELYCAGHMLEGAVAYYQATGRRRLLDIMLRYVDHIATMFGPMPGQKRGYCGHPEIELALIKLYHALGERKHLDLAAYFINERGSQPHYFDEEARARGEDPGSFWAKTYEYNQSHRPVREQDKVVGHAVRAMYMYGAMADLAADLGDDGLKRACEVLWTDVTSRRMYVTAGLGPAAANEGFTVDYDLPNDTAYAETCASVALIFWAKRMLNIELDGKYADVLELALYNGALSGLSRDGMAYFYANPLESDGHHRRWEWHDCPCCTMNVSRLVASVGGYFFSTGDDSLALHLYGGASATVTVGRHKVRISEKSNYPWSGAIQVSVTPEAPAEFTLKLRVPGWAKSPSLRVNGEAVDVAANTTAGYVGIKRRWTAGDTVDLDLPMAAERVYAHPNVRMDIGRACLRHGPFIYLIEQADNATPVDRARLPRTAGIKPAFRGDLFGGIVTLVAEGEAASSGDGAELYGTRPPALLPATWTAIPYYLWNNRQPGKMLVWIPERDA